DQPPALRVPQRKGEHPAQVLDAARPVLPVKRDQRLDIGRGAKNMAVLFQRGAQFQVIVNLAVVRDGDRSIGALHGQRRSGSQVQHREAAARQPARAERQRPPLIRPAMFQAGVHRFERGQRGGRAIERQDSTEAAHQPPTTSRYTASVRSTIASTVNCASRRARPASPRRQRPSGSLSAARSAPAIAVGSSGGTSQPVSPSAITSGIALTRVLITGTPSAIASRNTNPKPSQREGASSPSNAAKIAAASARQPRKWTRSASPSRAACASSASRNGPSPATT